MFDHLANLAMATSSGAGDGNIALQLAATQQEVHAYMAGHSARDSAVDQLMRYTPTP